MAFIVRRRAVLYARIRVPTDLAEILGTHVARTLHTPDRRIGQTRGALFRAQSAAIFERMKQEANALILGIPIDDLQQSDLVGCDRGRLSAEIESLTDAQRRLLRAQFAFLVDRAERDLAEERQGTDMAVDVLEALKSARQAGLIEGLRQAQAPARHETKFQEATEAHDPRTGLKLSELLDSYFADRSMKPKSAEETRVSVRHFEAETGGKLLKNIKNVDVSAFKSWLQERPGRAGRERASYATVQKSLGHIKTVLKWANVEAGIIAESVGQNVQPRKRTREEKEPRRISFDNAQ